ncbi:MAG: RsmB/NOP family class I SAM-dependent RNA methyltransferase [Pseudobdellovibrionaceae bacterium]
MSDQKDPTDSPLKFHRLLVENIISAVAEIFTQSRYADKVIERVLKSQKKWGARDRRFVAESIYEIVRWWRYLGALAGFDPTEKRISSDDIWQLWAAWCFNNYHALPQWEEFKSFDKAAFEQRKSSITSVAILESVPQWLYDYGLQEFGSEWNEILKSLNKPAEVFIRANTLRGTREDLIKKLQAEGIEGVPVPGVESAVRLANRKNVMTSESFKQGYFEVQDAASQLIAPLLHVEPGLKVVDACAGGGGKSLHLAALMRNQGKLICMDIHGWKLNELKERANRNRVEIIETREIDSPKVLKRLESDVDRLLLDVPCSGLGVLRRNPDTKWKLSLEEIKKLQQLQAEILETYSKMVKPGGMMVYATCSVLPAENQQQVERFLGNHSQDWKLVEEIHSFPHREGFDGFYGALLLRRS